MKTKFRMRQHSVLPEHLIVELWWHGQFIGEVTGADGPGVRVLSKFPTQVVQPDGPDSMVAEVRIDVGRRPDAAA